MQLEGRNVVVVGLGRSGIASAQLCLRRGAKVVATDSIAREKAPAQMLALEGHGATLVLGGHEGVDWAAADLVVISPGVPPFAALAQVERSGREVIGELELASRLVAAPIALVGGTNGKSTVTTLLGQMLEHGGRKVFAGGNLGTPLAEVVDEPFDALVLEISSFQAERIPTLHARAAALLNITDDHLDRYPDFAAYAQAKGNMFVGMGPQDVAVIPAGDEVCARQAARGLARVVTFGPGGQVRAESGWLVDEVHGWRVELASMKLQGAHNALNACASMAMAAAMGGTEQGARQALSTFAGLSHRTVLVGEVGGVRYYDDSKGTNVGAAVAALRGMREGRAVLIAGGRDKQGSYEPLVDTLRERGRALVLIGEAADRIAQAARGAIAVYRAATMDEAVQRASELAQAGDAVLLSPACSSFDMYKNYAERGDAFAAAVRRLVAGTSPLPAPIPRSGGEPGGAS